MNFEEFKKRYEAKLIKAGLTIPEEGDADYQSFQDQIATIYVGITIYSEIQHEAMQEQLKKAQEEAAKRLRQEIYVPHKGIIQ